MGKVDGAMIGRTIVEGAVSDNVCRTGDGVNGTLAGRATMAGGTLVCGMPASKTMVGATGIEPVTFPV